MYTRSILTPIKYAKKKKDVEEKKPLTEKLISSDSFSFKTRTEEFLIKTVSYIAAAHDSDPSFLFLLHRPYNGGKLKGKVQRC